MPWLANRECWVICLFPVFLYCIIRWVILLFARLRECALVELSDMSTVADRGEGFLSNWALSPFSKRSRAFFIAIASIEFWGKQNKFHPYM